ncbi:MAG: filamentous hemagglutinin N-terminal domain-containing protein [Coleofasciculaceae cyanobacterium]
MTFSLLSQYWQWKFVGCVALVGTLSAGVSENVLAQIVPDNTLGAESSVVTPDVNIKDIPSDQIDGGAIREANLFHSFQEFNVLEGRGAYFTNPAGIENILTRVTGGDASNLFGRLGVLGEANLFLLNPNGILFGPNASLDVQGSFLATTADAVRLGDGGYFSAVEPQTSNLLSVAPGALFFTQVANQPTAIINQGNLSTGEHLTLSAGNLDLQGELEAGGDLTLQAQDTVKVRDTVTTPFLAQSGGNLTVMGNDGIDILALNHPTQTPFVSGGNLSLISDGQISTDAHFASGGDFSIRTLGGSAGSFGSLKDPIFTVGGNYIVGDYTGASLQVSAGGNIDYGTVVINAVAPNVHPTNPAFFLNAGRTITGTGDVSTTVAEGELLVDFQAEGNISTRGITTSGGSINLNSTGGAIAANGSLKSSSNFGNGGAITLTAGDDITTTGYIQSHSDSEDGDGGAIVLTAGGNISTEQELFALARGRGNGNGGAIALTAGGDISTNALKNNSGGDEAVVLTASGNIITNRVSSSSGEIVMTAGGNISTGALRTDAGGNGGSITLTADGNISTESIRSDSLLYGNGGAIALTAGDNISISRGYISSNAADPIQGKGGAIALTALNGRITIDSNFPPITINASGAAGGGNITFTSPAGIFELENGSIRSNASGLLNDNASEGNGGNIEINAASVSLTDTELTTTTTGRGNAGTITITADGLVSLDTSRLFTSLELGRIGRGGNITIDAGAVSLTNDSFIDTATFGEGDAGEVSITADDFVSLDNDSAIFSITAGQGDGGNVTVKAGGAVSLVNRSNISTAVNSGAEGDGGDVEITARSLSLTGGSQLVTSTSSSGKAGNIIVNTTEGIFISGVNSNPTPTRNVSVGNPPSLAEFEPNDSIDRAQPLTQFFLNSPDDVNANVEFSTAIPYASVTGRGMRVINSYSGGKDYYSFEVLSAGTRAIFDIDRPEQGGAITNLDLIDSAGNSLEYNLADSPSLGAGGSTALDPYIRYVFNEPGTYFVEVEAYPGSYTLHVSLDAPNVATSVVNGTLPSGLFARTEGAGAAGNITVSTPLLSVTDGGNVSATATAAATSTARGGNIELNTSQINLQGNNSGIFAQTEGAASAGLLRLQPSHNEQSLTVNLQDNAQISASTSGSGQGGNLILTAPQAAIISGNGQLSVETSGAGAGGNLDIDTQKLTIENGTKVSASTSSPDSSGVGGNLTVNAAQSLEIEQASLLAQSTGAAPAGNVEINTGNLTARDGNIATSSEQSSGGGITITADQIRLRGDSDITTNVNQGAGGGGNINLTADSILAFNDSDILAFAQDGKGGDITLNTPAFFGEGYRPELSNTEPVDTLDGNDRVDINASGAVSGVITLPDTTFIQNSLTELPNSQIDTESLLANSCIVRRHQSQQGSFFITGTGSLPQRPGDAQMSSFPTVDIETLPSDSTPSTTNPNRPWQKGDPIIEPTGVYRLPNGKLVLSRECS